jgi:hypothetical protein
MLHTKIIKMKEDDENDLDIKDTSSAINEINLFRVHKCLFE